MARLTKSSNLRIHSTFPPMAPITPSHLGGEAEPQIDRLNYQVAINRQPAKETFTPADTPQYA